MTLGNTFAAWQTRIEKAATAVALDEDASGLMAVTCSGRWIGAWGDIRCPNPATERVAYSCPCGDLSVDEVCDECAARSKRLIEGGHVICTTCEDDGPGNDAHDCRVALAATAETPRTIDGRSLDERLESIASSLDEPVQALGNDAGIVPPGRQK